MANEQEEVVIEKKSSSSLVIIIIIVLLVLLLAIGGLIMFLLNSPQDEDVNSMSIEQTSQQLGNKGKRPSNPSSIGPVIPMDQFIVNLLSESGSRFLKVQMDIELSNDNLLSELDKKRPMLRDIVIRTLSSKTFEEISTMKGKERLKDELVDKMNEVLVDGYIKNIFFTDFVVQ